MTNENVCACVFLQSLAMLDESIYKLCTFLLQATLTATPPLRQITQTIN